jgi:hypothetical protein
MEGRIGNHGNQKESKKGHQEKALNWPDQSKKGDAKSVP